MLYTFDRSAFVLDFEFSVWLISKPITVSSLSPSLGDDVTRVGCTDWLAFFDCFRAGLATFAALGTGSCSSSVTLFVAIELLLVVFLLLDLRSTDFFFRLFFVIPADAVEPSCNELTDPSVGSVAASSSGIACNPPSSSSSSSFGRNPPSLSSPSSKTGGLRRCLFLAVPSSSDAVVVRKVAIGISSRSREGAIGVTF